MKTSKKGGKAVNNINRSGIGEAGYNASGSVDFHPMREKIDELKSEVSNKLPDGPAKTALFNRIESFYLWGATFFDELVAGIGVKGGVGAKA